MNDFVTTEIYLEIQHPFSENQDNFQLLFPILQVEGAPPFGIEE